MFTGTYLYSLIKIGSVTAEILLILSLCGVVGWGVHSHYVVKPNLVLWLGWGFDKNMSLKSAWLNSQQTIDMVLLTSTTTFCTGAVIFWRILPSLIQFQFASSVKLRLALNLAITPHPLLTTHHPFTNPKGLKSSAPSSEHKCKLPGEHVIFVDHNYKIYKFLWLNLPNLSKLTKKYIYCHFLTKVYLIPLTLSFGSFFIGPF